MLKIHRHVEFDRYEKYGSGENVEIVHDKTKIFGAGHSGWQAGIGRALSRELSALRRPSLPSVRQIKSEGPASIALSAACDDAHVLQLAISSVPACRLWQADHAISVGACPADFFYFFDLRRPARLDIPNGHDVLQFHLPNAVLRDCAAQQGQLFNGSLSCDLSNGHDDPVVRHLGLTMLSILEHGDETGGPLTELVLQAVTRHVVVRYGEQAVGRSPKGGLAAWQERRAKEMMEANLAVGITLGQLAEICGLSSSHFARAFRRSTGTSPHRWLQERRIERAMRMLGSSRVPLATIAQACGFADQSHFTKIFTQIIGTSPGQWRRRSRRSAPSSIVDP